MNNPGSLNRYSYTWGDPVNSNDPTGLCIINGETFHDPCFTATGTTTAPPGTGGGGSGPGRQPPGIMPLDPPPLTIQQVYVVAVGLQTAFRRGTSDCEALADFADAMADGSRDDAQFVRDFGVLTPNSTATQIPGAGIAWNTRPVALNTGQASGFGADYQNTLPDDKRTGWNGDQAHHFAAFFQFGYVHSSRTLGGTSLADVASFTLEYFQGLDSGVMNLGDVRLGERAGQIGADLMNGRITRGQVGMEIRSTLCRH